MAKESTSRSQDAKAALDTLLLSPATFSSRRWAVQQHSMFSDFIKICKSHKPLAVKDTISYINKYINLPIPVVRGKATNGFGM